MAELETPVDIFPYFDIIATMCLFMAIMLHDNHGYFQQKHAPSYYDSEFQLLERPFLPISHPI